MCDTFVVVGDDRVLFAKNSDRDPNEAQVLSWVPAREHPLGSMLQCTWSRISQVRRTHALILGRPYWMWGAEMGVNEHGVAIGNEAVFTRGPFDAAGLTGMDLVRLGLERGTTAAQAVELICALNTAHGQGGRCGYTRPGFRYHSSFLVADRREAWVIETAGRESTTLRITRGVRAISNGITLEPLRDRARGLHERIAGARRRRERVECLAVGVRDAAGAARVLADHGASDAVQWHWWNGALHAPCVHAGGVLAASQTVNSWISELCVDGARHWATGTSAPCTSLFRPLDFARPRLTGTPTGAPDRVSLWWRHERLQRHLQRAPQARPEAFAADRERTQRAIFAGAADGWDLAEDWLARWEGYTSATPDSRPWWLRRYWRGVEREATAGARLPWRDP